MPYSPQKKGDLSEYEVSVLSDFKFSIHNCHAANFFSFCLLDACTVLTNPILHYQDQFVHYDCQPVQTLSSEIRQSVSGYYLFKFSYV